MRLALLFAFSALFVSTANAEGVCSYYTEKANDLGCNGKNYLVAFGYRYCTKFEKRHQEFSATARPVLERLRLCLIEEMEAAHPTCETSRDIGYANHVDCYVAAGFCSLKKSDMIQILWHVRSEFLNPRFRRAANQILASCRRI